MDKTVTNVLVLALVVGGVLVAVKVFSGNSSGNAGALQPAPEPGGAQPPANGQFSDTPGGTIAGIGTGLGSLLGGVSGILREQNRHAEETAAEQRRREEAAANRNGENRTTETRAGSGR